MGSEIPGGDRQRRGTTTTTRRRLQRTAESREAGVGGPEAEGRDKLQPSARALRGGNVPELRLQAKPQRLPYRKTAQA